MIIPDYLYQYVYLLIITFLTVICMKNKRVSGDYESPVSSILLVVFLILFIGFRPAHSYYFGDTMNYANWWGLIPYEGFDFNAENLFFDNLYRYMAEMWYDVTEFFILIAIIYFVFMGLACRKFFPHHTMLALLVYLAAFSTFTYGTNGIKAGAAASIFLLALAYRDTLYISIPLVLLSWGFHHSMHLVIGAYVLTFFFKNKKWYFYGWLFCLMMAIGHITFFQNLFAGFTNDNGANYLTSSSDTAWGGKSGFRIDFVIYSAMPVLMGYYVKYKYELEDKLYDTLLYIYLTTNGIWMLCMYAEFTNRIAYLSWFMYPILLIYPCFAIKERQHPLVMNRNKYIMYHLGFTLFMTFIYY